nr:MAG TPA: Head Tail Connector Protein [Caudoviricetes sp.]
MFYITHDIDSDPNEYRVKMFRMAMVVQIDFAKSTGVVTAYDIAQQSIKSVSIDGTTVTTDKTLSDLTRDGLYDLARQYLLETGLLYRGAWIC